MYEYDEAEMQLLEEHYQLMEVKLTLKHIPFLRKITRECTWPFSNKLYVSVLFKIILLLTSELKL